MRTVDMQRHDAHAPHGPRGVSAGQKLDKDPVCGMTVPADAPLRATYQGEMYVFCSEHCRARFEKEPERYARKDEGQGAPLGAAPAAHQPGPHDHAPSSPVAPAPDSTPQPGAPMQWTCPMHPEIVRDAPGTLPDLRHGARAADGHADEPDNPELRRHDAAVLGRAALSVPLCSLAMAHMMPVAASSRVRARAPSAPWLELALATPVVPVGRLAVLRARRRVDREPQPQHVHADRARRRRSRTATASCAALARASFPASFRDDAGQVRRLLRGRRR